MVDFGRTDLALALLGALALGSDSIDFDAPWIWCSAKMSFDGIVRARIKDELGGARPSGSR